MAGKKKSGNEKNKRLEETIRIITDLSNNGFFGKAIITFEDGHAMLVRTEENIRLTS